MSTEGRAITAELHLPEDIEGKLLVIERELEAIKERLGFAESDAEKARDDRVVVKSLFKHVEKLMLELLQEVRTAKARGAL